MEPDNIQALINMMTGRGIPLPPPDPRRAAESPVPDASFAQRFPQTKGLPGPGPELAPFNRERNYQLDLPRYRDLQYGLEQEAKQLRPPGMMEGLINKLLGRE